MDNWYFINPVNQKKQTEYSGFGYGIDRWKSENDNIIISLTSNGLKFSLTSYPTTAVFGEQLENYNSFVGNTLTFSLLWATENDTSNHITSCTVTIPDSSLDSENIGLNDGTTSKAYGYIDMRKISSYNIQVRYVSSLLTESIYFIAAKLEVGENQTLAYLDDNGIYRLTEIPNYEEQLARCQRYMQVLGNSSMIENVGFGMITYYNGNSAISAQFPITTTLAKVPAVSIKGTLRILRPSNENKNIIVSYINENDVNITNPEGLSNIIGIGLIVSPEKLPYNIPYVEIDVPSNSGYILLDSNL